MGAAEPLEEIRRAQKRSLRRISDGSIGENEPKIIKNDGSKHVQRVVGV